MLLLLKDAPVLQIRDNGECRILDFDRLPFALRKENVTFVEFMDGHPTARYRSGEAMQRRF